MRTARFGGHHWMSVLRPEGRHTLTPPPGRNMGPDRKWHHISLYLKPNVFYWITWATFNAWYEFLTIKPFGMRRICSPQMLISPPLQKEEIHGKGFLRVEQCLPSKCDLVAWLSLKQSQAWLNTIFITSRQCYCEFWPFNFSVKCQFEEI